MALGRVMSAAGLRGLAADARWLLREAPRHRSVQSALRGLQARWRLREALEIDGTTEEVVVLPPQALHPLVVRRNASDAMVYKQVFVDEEYGPVDTGEITGLIIDCGAYVGYSSAWFLSHYPRCSVIAVEPDADNYRTLCRNLRSYGSRVHALNAGVWSEAGYLRIAADRYRDGREWSRQVFRCPGSEPEAIPAVSIPTLLGLANASRIALLKVDIEGAEAILFGPRSAEWIQAVDRIAIELHDDTTFGDCRAIFFKSIAQQGFAVSTSGELTLCRRALQSSMRPSAPCT